MKLEEKKDQNFQLSKTLKAHVLPLTNCSFNKNGDKYPILYTDSSRAATIELAKYGTQRQEILYINWKGIKMLFTHLPLMYPSGKRYEI